MKTLTDHEISSVIWYTVSHRGHPSWHNFAKNIMRAQQDAEFLAAVQALYTFTFEAPIEPMSWQEKERLVAALKLLEN